MIFQSFSMATASRRSHFNRSPQALKIRIVWLGLLILSMTSFVQNVGAQSSPKNIVSTDARAQAEAGELLIIDVRSPQEWQQTGIGDLVTTNSMHVRGFMERLTEIVGEDKDRPIGFICAVGGRSTSVSTHLAQRGYTNVYNITDGMLGSNKGPGWIDAGLPTRKYEE